MYYIHFYSREKGGLAKKTGYRTKGDAETDLRRHGFFPAGGDVWDSLMWIARVKEENK